MIRTVVCQREGCCGNKFHIETIDNNLEITCKECGSKYLFDVSYYDFVMLSNCSSCNNGNDRSGNNWNCGCGTLRNGDPNTTACRTCACQRQFRNCLRRV